MLGLIKRQRRLMVLWIVLIGACIILSPVFFYFVNRHSWVHAGYAGFLWVVTGWWARQCQVHREDVLALIRERNRGALYESAMRQLGGAIANADRN